MRSVVQKYPIGISFLLLIVLMAPLHAEHRYQLPAVEHPKDNQPSEARRRLGKMLFFDPRLSGSNTISCASCHKPTLMWSDVEPAEVERENTLHIRSTPTVLDSAYRRSLMWDGAADSLEKQAILPVVDPHEMDQPLDELLVELAGVSGYRSLFMQAYGGDEISPEIISKALAVYQRSLLSTETPFDRWMSGHQQAISNSAQRGFALFEGKAGCVICHSGPSFSDDSFHYIGVEKEGEQDLGRYYQRPVTLAKRAFKVPGLRNISLTAPYMHNGRFETLRQVIDHYAAVKPRQQGLSPNLNEIDLSEQEKQDLLSFLNALTSIEPPLERAPKLPR